MPFSGPLFIIGSIGAISASCLGRLSYA
ncbi:hypothetical protein ACLK18_10885 [Escherichia coli]